MSAKELNTLVTKAREKGIEAVAFDELYKCCGGDYCNILYILNAM